MPLIPILILAAGASSRMAGRDKLIQEVRGQVLLANRVEAALPAGQPIYVTLPPKNTAPARWQAIAPYKVTQVSVTDCAAGIAASLVAGIGALPEHADGVLIMLADMPDIDAADIQAVLAAFDGRSVVRGSDGQRNAGHPVLFPVALFEKLRVLKGDRGAQPVLVNHENLKLVELPDQHALTDLDTPKDWQKWRARQ